MQNLFRVVSQSEPVSINTQNGNTLQKSTVVLQEVNGRADLGEKLKMRTGASLSV